MSVSGFRVFPRSWNQGRTAALWVAGIVVAQPRAEVTRGLPNLQPQLAHFGIAISNDF